MAVKSGEVDSDLIDSVRRGVRARLSDGQAALGEAFVRQYYRWVPAEDLAGRGTDDLLGAALAHLDQARMRRPGETKVRVFNPRREVDGFDSPYTVVEIVSDDMPFIVDSLTMELARRDYNIELSIHPVIRVRRDPEGRLLEVLEPEAVAEGAVAESVLRAEVAQEPDQDRLDELATAMRGVLEQVQAVVEDWQAMRTQAQGLAAALARQPPPVPADERMESQAFLEWLTADNFTFLGYREYEVVADRGQAQLQALPSTGLGILRGPPATPVERLAPRASELALSQDLLVLTIANSRATVHRPARLDYIGVKRLADDGTVIGEHRFLGLYTTEAYRTRPPEIPVLRHKVQTVLDRAGLPPGSHDHKALTEILETYPRDALFQIGGEDLFVIAMGLLGLGERPRVRLLAWEDPYGRFVSCTLTIPRDRFNTEARERAGRILMEAWHGTQLDVGLQLSESLLVRVNYVVWRDAGPAQDYELPEIESRIVQALRDWSDELGAALRAAHGSESGAQLHRRYRRAFPAGYRSDCGASMAVADIDQLERLETVGASLRLYQPESAPGTLRCRLYSSVPVTLSEILPTFEHMGAKVIDERPYRITPDGGPEAWIYDLGLRCQAEDLKQVQELFEEAFIGVQRGQYEDDGLAGLVLRAALSGREIVILRAVARYLRQAGIPYSDAYMERTLNAHPEIARLMVKLFQARFSADRTDGRLGERLSRTMDMAIDGVPSLDEDRILRSFLSVIRAVLRTSYFRTDPSGEPLPYVSFKLDPAAIPLLPRPKPQFEIYVYSPRFEGVHLRGGRVARGGIRWSDRPEDFRSEILGLMKAQMVKNALIVPVGAKGGFVLKSPPAGSASALRDEAIACYRMFLSGLLDLTDNIVGQDVVGPPQVVRYDGDDPYLVVAADKGTAAFSDLANEVSDAYGFWLGDAFASGGSRGYDHKKMGITARGAWESVKRHFRELGTDIQSSDFTVVGIGDMSGDVFGNAMLLSPRIRLVAAFNHAHVFLDPDPDPESAFVERRRLFDLAESTWRDYDARLISDGGGVYERSLKSIRVSEPVRRALDIDAEELSPAELIRAILCAPVDLLFNGGIGTYVKSSAQTHADAVDKANDPLRVDGRDLRCAVVGEGGNLGFTQMGRIEYARAGGPAGEGGRINTDAIDNAAGVNSSDHEVNIKILVDAEVRQGRLRADDRDALLAGMTDAVAERVLYASYRQTQAISLARAQAGPMIDVHDRLIRWLEQSAGVDRELEGLPSEDELSARKSAHQGLLAPEISVLMAHTKIRLFSELLDSDLPEDEYLARDVADYFPAPLPERFGPDIPQHRLRREIMATVVANQLVDRSGTTFAFRLAEETGASIPLLARGFAVSRAVFRMRSFWAEVEALDNRVEASMQVRMLLEGRRLIERSIRALVRQSPSRIDVAATVERFEPSVHLVERELPRLVEGADAETLAARADELKAAGVPRSLAERVAAMMFEPAVFDIALVAHEGGYDLAAATRVYFRVQSRLELGWLRDRIVELPRANRWQALARSALREELLSAHRDLTREVLAASGGAGPSDDSTDRWIAQHQRAVERSLQTLADIRASRLFDTTTLSVALREVRALIGRGG